MADIKLIATDLDGTFMMDFRTPHPDNVRVLKKCKARGIAFCICTGRNWSGVRDLAHNYPFDRFCVINNGASIYDSKTDTLRYRNRFHPDIAREILKILCAYKTARIDVTTTDATHFLQNRIGGEMRRKWIESVQNNPEQSRNFHVHASLDDLIEAAGGDIQRINVGIDIIGPGMLKKVYDQIRVVSDVEITSGGVGQMEITAENGTKAEALSILADIFEAQPQNILALGDNYNDLHMLLWAGTGVAMGNADPRLKNVADYVTDTNVNGGVAKAIEHIVFGVDPI